MLCRSASWRVICWFVYAFVLPQLLGTKADVLWAQNGVCGEGVGSLTWVHPVIQPGPLALAVKAACSHRCSSDRDCLFFSTSLQVVGGRSDCLLSETCPAIEFDPGKHIYMRTRFSSWRAFELGRSYGPAKHHYAAWIPSWIADLQQASDARLSEEFWAPQSAFGFGQGADPLVCHPRHDEFISCCVVEDDSSCPTQHFVWRSCESKIAQWNSSSSLFSSATCTEELLRLLAVWGGSVFNLFDRLQGQKGELHAQVTSRALGFTSFWTQLAQRFPLNVAVWTIFAYLQSVDVLMDVTAPGKDSACLRQRGALPQTLTDEKPTGARGSLEADLTLQVTSAMRLVEITFQMLSLQFSAGTLAAVDAGEIRDLLLPMYAQLHKRAWQCIYNGVRWRRIQGKGAAATINRADLRGEAIHAGVARAGAGGQDADVEEHDGVDDEVHIVFALQVPQNGKGGGSLSGADFGHGVSAVTVRSLLRHTKARAVTFHVLGDAPVASALQTAFAADPRARFHAWDIQQSAGPWLHQLPSQCIEHNPSMRHWGDPRVAHSILARLFVQEILPVTVRRALVLDVGDTLVLGDVLELLGLIDAEFSEEQAVGMARHMAAERILAPRVQERAQFNGGVVLLDLHKLRELNASMAIVAAANRAAMRYANDADFCSLLDQDIWNELFRPGYWRSRLYILDCAWNYLPVGAASGDLFGWNRPELWVDEVRHWHLFPGLLRADHIVHYCGSTLEHFGHTLPWSVNDDEFTYMRKVSEQQGRTAVEGGTLLGCKCGERVRLLHAMGKFRMFAWARELFAAWQRQSA